MLVMCCIVAVGSHGSFSSLTTSLRLWTYALRNFAVYSKLVSLSCIAFMKLDTGPLLSSSDVRH